MNSERERAYLLNFYFKKHDVYPAEDDLKELKMLVDTAGAEIVGKENLYLRKINPAYFITKGKLEKIKESIQQNNIDVIIINTELKPVQVRNLESFFNCKVIGRTELILDIFAQHARTSEAKIQVELAQLKYLLPRLTGHGILLSRLGGGIGTRGPGETKLEYDRRHIMRRIATLQRKLKKIEKHRTNLWKNRKFKVATLVGYTNAGKTTLLNTLSQENLKTENRLFVTLDPTIRKVYLNEKNKYVLISDTVGFIKNIPHTLVASFKATLSEVKNSDLILHIVDICDRNIEEKINTVNEVLSEIGVNSKNSVVVFNKIDRLNDESKIKRFTTLYPDAIFISAKEKINIDKLKKIILIKVGEK